MLKKHDNIWIAFSKTIEKYDGVDYNAIISHKILNEARSEYFKNGSTVRALWLDGGLYNQRLTSPNGSSTNLAINLERVYGFKKLPNMDAHHIIPKGQVEARGLVELLKRYDIHVDDVSNGMWLPSKRTKNALEKGGGDPDWLDGLGPNHQNHPNNSSYINQLKEDLDYFNDLEPNVTNKEFLKDELQNIAKKLIEGDYPWP